ncbi:MAG: D-arabinono-1,4-lactone oxidase [Nocardioidaceae bacterium]
MTADEWTNWAGTEQCRPLRARAPRDIGDVRAAIDEARAAGITVRAVGSGHSFTGAALAPGLSLGLGRMAGLGHVDVDSGVVRVWAGTTLRELSMLLDQHGLALPDLGDVDTQTISGAIATGTHGTGARLGGLATAVAAVEMVAASGEVVTCARDEDPELLEAVAVSLGTLGIVTRVTLQCVPAFALRAVERQEVWDELVAGIQESADTHDHFEFHWFPHTDRALVKRNDRLPPGTELDPVPGWRRLFDDELLSNVVYEGVNRVSAWRPGWVPRINQISARALGAREYVDVSHRVFVSPRRVRFTECEYAVPREAVADVLTELRGWIDRHDVSLPFPVEVRFAARDRLWLSTAYERDVAYVAVHQYHRMPAAEYFGAFEEIAAEVGGRPHWGKLHSLGATRLRDLYPRFDEFLALRDKLDPDRLFANPYTTRVFGP